MARDFRHVMRTSTLTGILLRVLMLCLAINFWGCAAQLAPEYTPLSNVEPLNTDYQKFVMEQIRIVNSFRGRKFKDFMLENPIKFEEHIAIPDAEGGYLYTLRLKLRIPYIQKRAVNQYGSSVSILEYQDLIFSLFANPDGILQEVLYEFRVRDTQTSSLLSAEEKQVMQNQANESFAILLVTTLGLGIVLAAAKSRRY